jgi:hypothetical protein
MPPKRSVGIKRGGSIASDAVMNHVPPNAFHVISAQNFFEGGGRRGGRRGGKTKTGGRKSGGAPTNSVVGQGEIGRVGFPEFPQANARYDLSMVPTVQQTLAAQVHHTMGAVPRGLTYPNQPHPVNPIVFGGAVRRRTSSTTTTKRGGRRGGK